MDGVGEVDGVDGVGEVDGVDGVDGVGEVDGADGVVVNSLYGRSAVKLNPSTTLAIPFRLVRTGGE